METSMTRRIPRCRRSSSSSSSRDDGWKGACSNSGDGGWWGRSGAEESRQECRRKVKKGEH